MKKSLKIAFAAAVCTIFALTLTFCGSKTETVVVADSVVVEPAPVIDTLAVDTLAVDTTAAQ